MKEDLLLDKRQKNRKTFGTIFLAKNRKAGKILFPTVIFFVLNIMFFGILLIFVFRSSGGVIVYEQAYAKQIALLIDESKPVMKIKLNMEEAINLAEKNGVSKDEIVKINENFVIVKLSEKGGYSYSFFNNVDVTAYPDITNKNYIIIINKYK